MTTQQLENARVSSDLRPVREALCKALDSAGTLLRYVHQRGGYDGGNLIGLGLNLRASINSLREQAGGGSSHFWGATASAGGSRTQPSVTCAFQMALAAVRLVAVTYCHPFDGRFPTSPQEYEGSPAVELSWLDRIACSYKELRELPQIDISGLRAAIDRQLAGPGHLQSDVSDPGVGVSGQVEGTVLQQRSTRFSTSPDTSTRPETSRQCAFDPPAEATDHSDPITVAQCADNLVLLDQAELPLAATTAEVPEAVTESATLPNRRDPKQKKPRRPLDTRDDLKEVHIAILKALCKSDHALQCKELHTTPTYNNDYLRQELPRLVEFGWVKKTPMGYIPVREKCVDVGGAM